MVIYLEFRKFASFSCIYFMITPIVWRKVEWENVFIPNLNDNHSPTGVYIMIYDINITANDIIHTDGLLIIKVPQQYLWE